MSFCEFFGNVYMKPFDGFTSLKWFSYLLAYESFVDQIAATFSHFGHRNCGATATSVRFNPCIRVLTLAIIVFSRGPGRGCRRLKKTNKASLEQK